MVRRQFIIYLLSLRGRRLLNLSEYLPRPRPPRPPPLDRNRACSIVTLKTAQASVCEVCEVTSVATVVHTVWQKNKHTFHCTVLCHQVHKQHHLHLWDLQIPKGEKKIPVISTNRRPLSQLNHHIMLQHHFW